MKQVILCADGDSLLCRVPDIVADDLGCYCLEFAGHWLWKGPERERFIRDGAAHYDALDFIDYLSRWLFPDCPSAVVENLGWTNLAPPEAGPYRNLPFFSF